MDCCCSGAKIIKESPQNACGECGEIGRVVARQTVVHHVISENFRVLIMRNTNFVCPKIARSFIIRLPVVCSRSRTCANSSRQKQAAMPARFVTASVLRKAMFVRK